MSAAEQTIQRKRLRAQRVLLWRSHPESIPAVAEWEQAAMEASADVLDLLPVVDAAQALISDQLLSVAPLRAAFARLAKEDA